MLRLHHCQWQSFRKESQKLLSLAIPILFAQLALTGLGVVDTLMSGWVGVNDLAAIGLGTSIMLPVFIMGTGILLAITPLVAKIEGHKQHSKLPDYLFQGIWVALPVGLISLILLMNMQWLLNQLQLNPKLYQLTEDYLYFIAFGLPGVALYQALRFYWEGLGKTLPTMWISFSALILNIPLNALFIYGYGPIDAMGAAGCGVASSLVMWTMFVLGFIYISRSDLAGQRIKWRKFHRPGWDKGFGSILKLGAPNAMALLFEVSLFTFIALFIAPLGATIIAGHQIAISFTSLLFMLPLSLGMAVTVRVGSTFGQQNPDAILSVIRTSLLVALFVGLLLAVFTYGFKEWIVALYTNDIEVFLVAVSLLVFAAIYQLFDAVQVIAAGCLRGFHDTKVTMWITLISYWGAGLGIGYLLAFTDWILPAMGVEGFWVGIVLGLSLSAILLCWRLNSIYNREVKVLHGNT